MAIGQGQGGGLFAQPDMPSLGPATWADMGGVHPDSPLVGGRGAPSGGIDPDFKYRRVAVASVDVTPASGGSAGSFSELLNFKGNPLPWILIAAIAYLGLVHVSIAGSAGVGRK